MISEEDDLCVFRVCGIQRRFLSTNIYRKEIFEYYLRLS